MLIKEFRILMPMSVEEYQTGQLYTIQKKSRIESTGTGSGVEIIENKPFVQNNETGQYTLKVYHADERLPTALKTIAKLLFPKSALIFEEEGWNFYPYTRTKYKHGYFKSFNIDIESKYLNDLGTSENVFNLTKSELSSRTVDYIDIVNDQINPNEYNKEEDPAYFVSQVNKRGPLSKTWIDELKAAKSKTVKYMCAYKLCRIEIAVWGCQSRVERLVSDSVLRHMILMSHRQAWCWQDEYAELTMDEVRRLELETQHYLNLKMRNDPNADNYLQSVESKASKARSDIASVANSSGTIESSGSKKSDDKSSRKQSSSKSKSKSKSKSPKSSLLVGSSELSKGISTVAELNENIAQSLANHNNKSSSTNHDISAAAKKSKEEASTSGEDSFTSQVNTNETSEYEDIISDGAAPVKMPTTAAVASKKSKKKSKLRRSSFSSKSSKLAKTSLMYANNTNNDSYDDENDEEPDDVSQNSNFDEFYDAISQASFNLSTNTNESIDMPASAGVLVKRRHSKTSSTGSYSISRMNSKSKSKQRNIRELNLNSGGNQDHQVNSKNSSGLTSTYNSILPSPSSSSSSSSNINASPSNNTHKMGGDNRQLSNKSANGKSKTDTLILVVHGGNVTCTDTLKASDLANFKSTVDSVMKKNYERQVNKIAYRLVPCESICQEALANLSILSPVANESGLSWNESSTETPMSVFSLHENLQFSTLPLLTLANQPKYREQVNKFIKDCNKIYQEFLASSEGPQFDGEVIIIGDSLGSLLAYDALSQPAISTTIVNESDYEHSPTSSSLNLPTSQQKQTPSPSPNRVKKEDSPRPGFVNPQISISSDDHNLKNNTNISSANMSMRHAMRNESNVFSFNNNNNKKQQQLPGSDASPTMYITPPLSSNSSTLLFDERLEFDVTHFFVLGSPLGLVLTHRKMANHRIEIPNCTQLYNMFHLTDPMAFRIEPLLCKQFRFIKPCMVARYSKFPLGDGLNITLDQFVLKYSHLFEPNTPDTPQSPTIVPSSQQNTVSSMKSLYDKNLTVLNEYTSNYLTPNYDQLKSLQRLVQVKQNWWGENRIDYVLYAPETISNLPKKSLPYIFHSCFWESQDAVAFILRIINSNKEMTVLNEGLKYSPSAAKNDKEPTEKWQKRLNRVKLRKTMAPNHRANDVIVLEDKEQIFSAKFSYGPLDFTLSEEKVDVFVMKNNSKGEWQLYDCAVTDSHGRLRYEVPASKRLPQGMYQIRMIVKCDRTYVDFYMCVLPPNTEAVVFSIDGSFAANISFSGNDPKVRAGSVDVVRHWQELGYLIIYITARPDMQHYKVTNWLAQHNFPLGMVFFSDGLSRDPIKQKTDTLKNIVVNNSISLQAAYGSSKDIQMYASLGVPSNRIFIIGRPKSKFQNQAVFIQNGYASHLSFLQSPNTGSRQASGNARLIIKKSLFSFRNLQFPYNDMQRQVSELDLALNNNNSSSLMANSNNSASTSSFHTSATAASNMSSQSADSQLINDSKYVKQQSSLSNTTSTSSTTNDKHQANKLAANLTNLNISDSQLNNSSSSNQLIKNQQQQKQVIREPVELDSKLKLKKV